MEQVDSADRTPIAFERTGTGPPLVIVVGAFCDRTSKKSLTATLASEYTVYEYDRRGRGDSGDTEPWSVDREIEDLAAMLEETGGSAYMFGESSGGALALGGPRTGCRSSPPRSTKCPTRRARPCGSPINSMHSSQQARRAKPPNGSSHCSHRHRRLNT
jgi:hypothetical protein